MELEKEVTAATEHLAEMDTKIAAQTPEWNRIVEAGDASVGLSPESQKTMRLALQAQQARHSAEKKRQKQVNHIEALQKEHDTFKPALPKEYTVERAEAQAAKDAARDASKTKVC